MKQRGFTPIEVLLAAAIVLVISGIGFSLYRSLPHSYKIQTTTDFTTSSTPTSSNVITNSAAIYTPNIIQVNNAVPTTYLSFSKNNYIETTTSTIYRDTERGIYLTVPANWYIPKSEWEIDQSLLVMSDFYDNQLFNQCVDTSQCGIDIYSMRLESLPITDTSSVSISYSNFLKSVKLLFNPSTQELTNVIPGGIVLQINDTQPYLKTSYQLFIPVGTNMTREVSITTSLASSSGEVENILPTIRSITSTTTS